MEANPEKLAYERHLRRRWAVALVQVVLCGGLGGAAMMFFEYQIRQHSADPLSLTQVLHVRTPVLLSPALGLVLRLFFVRASWMPTVATFLSIAYCVGVDFGFYVNGSVGSELHAVMIFVSLLCGGTMLPVTRRVRAVFFGATALLHIGFELFWDDARTGGARFWLTVPILVGVLSLWLTLELFFISHRRAFLLRNRMTATLEELRTSQAQIHQTANALAASVTHLSSNAKALVGRVDVSREESTRMLESSTEIAAIADSTLDRSRNSADIATEAQRNAREVDAVLHTFEEGVEEMAAAVTTSESSLAELEQRALKIGNFVTLIQTIANQTHLLSLNATLEAVRAGEHGRGFAIIAQQVRRLAEQSQDASREVQSVVESVRAQMDRSIRAMVAVRERTISFNAAFQEARRTLAGIEDVIHALQESMARNADDAQSQAVTTRGLCSATERLLELVRSDATLTAEVAQTTLTLADVASGLQSFAPDLPPSPSPSGATPAATSL